MKIKKAIILFLVIMQTAFVYSQKTISEGAIIYNVTIRSADKNSSDSIGSAVITTYLKGGQSRVEMSSSLGNESTIHDTKSGNSFILKEYSGQKLMIPLTKDNWDERNKKYDGINFSYENKSDEMVDGYNCKKATAKLNDGSSITVFYTNSLNVINKEYDAAFKNFAGFPVSYEVQNGTLTFEYKLSKVDFTPVSSAKFDQPKNGYRVMSYEESNQSKSLNN